MQRLIAIRDHYFERDHKVGDIYEADDASAALLVAARAVDPAPKSEPPRPNPRARTAAEAESFTRYRRRDMKAEK